MVWTIFIVPETVGNGLIIPTDFHSHFSEGFWINHQPALEYRCLIELLEVALFVYWGWCLITLEWSTKKPSRTLDSPRVPRPGGPGGRQQRNAGRGDVDECLRGESSRGPLRHVALSWWMMDADGCRWMLMDADGGWVVTWWSELFKLEGCQLEWGWMVSNVNRIWGTCPGAWPHPNIKATMVAKKIKRYISKTHKKKTWFQWFLSWLIFVFVFFWGSLTQVNVCYEDHPSSALWWRWRFF